MGIFRNIVLRLGFGVPTIPEIHDKIIQSNFTKDELEVIKRDGITCSVEGPWSNYLLSKSYDTSKHESIFRISKVLHSYEYYEYVALNLQETNQFLSHLPSMLPQIKRDIAKKILDHGSDIAESKDLANKEREIKQTIWKSL